MTEHPHSQKTDKDTRYGTGTEAPTARLRWIVVLGLVLLGAAIYAYRSGEKLAASAGGRGMSGPVTVDTEKAARRALYSSITAVGSLLAKESVLLRAEVAGVVEAAPFEEGQDVKKGMVLIRLDSAIQRAELSQAQASTVLAKSNFQRALTLGRSGAGSKQSLEQAQAELTVGTANVAAAQARLDKMELRSPIDGRVGILRVSAGNWVAAGDTLVNIEMINALKLDFSVPEIFLRNVSVGMPVTLTVDALGEQNFEGKITVIDPKVDEATRSLRVRAELPNTNLKLRPGLFARVTLDIKQAAPPLAISEAAIVPLADKTYVYRILDGKAQRVDVKTGLRNGGYVEIANGLSENDVIVIAGQMKLKDGAEVAVRNAPAPPESRPSEANGAMNKTNGANKK